MCSLVVFKHNPLVVESSESGASQEINSEEIKYSNCNWGFMISCQLQSTIRAVTMVEYLILMM